MMVLVILESPFAGRGETQEERDSDHLANVEYARAAMRDALLRGEAPMVSHLLYTQPGVLDDNDVHERAFGIDAGLAWGAVAERTVVYCERGLTRGMRYGIENAVKAGRPVELRASFPPYTGFHEANAFLSECMTRKEGDK